MTAELIYSDCRNLQLNNGQGRERESEMRETERKNARITTLALLIINTSVIAVLSFVQRQVAENKQYLRERW